MPTTLEAGYRNADFPIWIGMLAPARTPRAVVDRLNAETIKAVRTPAVQERLTKTGIVPLIMTPDRIRRAHQGGNHRQHRRRQGRRHQAELAHVPEKWVPVFQKDMRKR